jgi:hypothetical protein
VGILQSEDALTPTMPARSPLPKSLTFPALGITLFLAPAFWLMNGDTILTVSAKQVASALTQLFKASAVAQTPTPSSPQATPPTAGTPQRLTITISVSEPDDLKVKENQDLKRGDLIADRIRERDRLSAQLQQLELNLARLQSATISKPLPPATTPTIAQLPAPSYLEERAAIERAQAQVQQMEQTITLKNQEIQYLQSLQNLEPLVLEHEQAQLNELKQQHTAAVREYQLTVGKFATAREAQARAEYERSIALAQRADSHNRDGLEYQQQLSQYEQRLRDRDFQVSQTQLKLDEVNNAIATLAVVKSPYNGRVRRIKALGQGTDGSLSFALTLLVADDGDGDGGGSALSGQSPRMR